MATPELVRLLAQLKKTASPVGRMKLVARAWRIVRRLDGNERQELAAEVGLEGAEELLERLASRRGGRLSPSMLLQALEKVRGAEPRDLSQVISTLRRPEGRKQVIRKGLQALEKEDAKTLVAEPPAPPPPPTRARPLSPQPPLPHEKKASPAQPRSGAATAVAATATAAAATAAATAAAARATPPPATPAPRPTPAPSPPVASPAKPQPEERPASPAPAAPKPTPKPAPVAAPRPTRPPAIAPKWRPPRPTVAPRPEAEPVKSARAGSLVERLREASSLTERFRILRRGVDEARGLGARDLRELVEAFPAGWSRRRALAALLREKIPAELHHAAFLIEGLESPTAQRWCASMVLDRWSLSAEERDALIERHHLVGRRYH